ncbi:MAG: antitoxin [Spartobacteria bacterium]
MKTAKLFASGRSQAVRLPKEFRFEGDEVQVSKLGSAVLLMRPGAQWDLLKEACGYFSQDLMRQREQPPAQTRNF